MGFRTAQGRVLALFVFSHPGFSGMQNGCIAEDENALA
jgi:hypothetical protein